jgi:putative DNA primase/helicase
LLPGGKIVGHEYIVRNPKRADKRAGSFKIRVSGPKAGVWSDFAANAKGGDLVSLVAYLKSLSRPEAARWIQEHIMSQTNWNRARSPQPDKTPIQSVAATLESPAAAPTDESEAVTLLPPEGAEHPADALARMGCGDPDMKWAYRTAEGAIGCYVLRWNEADGSKKILPLSWVRSANGEGWKFKAWAEGRLLYNLDKIVANPSAAIMICEGEKAADAAGKVYARAYNYKGSSGNRVGDFGV